MKLPDPISYYKLNQVCERWGCEISLLIDYWACGMLNIGTTLTEELTYTDHSDNHSTSNISPKPTSGFFLVNSEDAQNILSSPPALIHEVYINLYENGIYKKRITYHLLGGHPLTTNDLFITRNELDDFQLRHKIDISDTPALPKHVFTNQTQLPIQAKRELVLTGWLAGRNIDTNIKIDLKQKDVWVELTKAAPELFAYKSNESIKEFFKKQKICSFRPGRKKGQ